MITTKRSFSMAMGARAHIGTLLNQPPVILQDGNTVAWYDSQDLSTITKDGANAVSRWNDKLGSGHDLLQATGTNQPLWDTDCIYFDGLDNFMKTASFPFIEPESIYIVIKQFTWNVWDSFFDGYTLNTGVIFQSASSPNIAAYGGGNVSPNIPVPLNEYFIIRVIFSDTGKIIINDNPEIPLISGAAMAGFTLGADGANSGFSNICVKEVILRKIDDIESDSQKIYSYLKKKYSL